ncbi:hypothetical protein [Glaciihabitans sp. UYNi722]|uniref:hypothetical protein n=1 Tax=Glaciihabitans sp. UYNi722 TaxID=3156344 RepID=UPI00339B7CF3
MIDVPLAAASLLAAAAAVILTYVRKNVDEALAQAVPSRRADREPVIRRLRRVLWTSAIPLGLFIVASLVVVAPFAIRVIGDVATDGPLGWHGFGSGEWVQPGAFLLFSVLLIGLLVMSALMIARLSKRLAKAAVPDADR